MTKDEAIKDARIGVLMQGGTWYVVRRGKSYRAMHESLYEGSKMGRVAEMFDLEKVRRTPPPTPAADPKRVLSRASEHLVESRGLSDKDFPDTGANPDATAVVMLDDLLGDLLDGTDGEG